MNDRWQYDFFERYLTSLSPQAFDCVIALGVRDVDSLVHISGAKLASNGVPLKIQEEILTKTQALQEALNPSISTIGDDNSQTALHESKDKSFTSICNKSVLSLSLAKLTAVDEESDTWSKPLSCYIDASENIWHRLASACIFQDDPMECIWSMRLGYLLSLNLGVEPFTILTNACGGLPECPLFLETRMFKEIKEPIYIENMLIDVFPLASDVLKRVNDYGWKRWCNFLDLSEEQILKQHGVSFEGLSRISDAYLLLDFALLIQSQWLIKPEFCIAPETMLKSFIHEYFPARILEVLTQRWGLGEKEPQTLEEIGQKVGVTRERIRQIEKKGLRILNGLKGHGRHASPCYHFIAPLIDKKFRESRGILGTYEAVIYFIDIMGWDSYLQREQQYLDFTLRLILPYDSQEKLYVDKKHPCVLCSVLSDELRQLFEQDNKERSYEEIFDYLRKICVLKKCKEAFLPFSKTFLQWVIRREEDILTDESSVYHFTTWSAKKGSRVQQIEEVLHESKRPMHFQEIYDALKVKYPLDQMLTPRNVHGALTRENAPFLLWDRGTFVHQDHISFPNDLISVVEKWLIDRLREVDSPLVLVGAAWDIFEKECLANGLISEYALYTCLRVSNAYRLVYPKYPQIYLKINFSTRIPYTFVIEDYIVQNGGVVSSEDLRFFAINTLGLKEYQFQQGLARIDGIFRNAHGEYVSIQSLKINFGILKKLNSYIVSLVQSLGSISIERILDDKAITCEQAGASDPVVLYNALKTIMPDELDYPGYPQICRLGGKNTRGLYSQVLEWLKNKEEPCSWDELEDFFIQERKYNENTVRFALQREEVFRYAQGVFVHHDALGITDTIVQVANAVVQNEFKRAQNVGKHFALISDVLINQPLPELKNDILWTQTLFAHVIDSMQDVRILGSARNAFICLPHPSNIETFEDLVYILLKELYGGACLLKDFEKYFQKEEIITKELTASMLHNQEKVVIHDGVLSIKIKDAHRP